MEGQLIVIEGVDGAGTTTQCGRLVSNLVASGRAAHATQEPSSGPVGALLRQTLSGRLVVGDPQGARAPDWRTMALLFAADRMDHLDAEILPKLREGVTVVCDRYYHSSVAYQSVSGDGSAAINWIRTLNQHARAPDLTIVVDAPPAVTAARRAQRGGEEIYDGASFQARLAAFYADLEQHFPGESIVHVDGAASIERVGADILGQVEASIARGSAR